MVIKKDISKKKFKINDGIFDLKKIYDGIKEKSSILGYTFFSKEEGFKPTQYGEEYSFNFHLVKIFDDFCRAEIDIAFLFNNLKKIKKIYNGDVNIEIAGKVELDRKHRWGKSSLRKGFLRLHMAVIKDKIKKDYLIPVDNDVEEIYNELKDLLNEYKH